MLPLIGFALKVTLSQLPVPFIDQDAERTRFHDDCRACADVRDMRPAAFRVGILSGGQRHQ
jgi:hypothetical protein